MFLPSPLWYDLFHQLDEAGSYFSYPAPRESVVRPDPDRTAETDGRSQEFPTTSEMTGMRKKMFKRHITAQKCLNMINKNTYGLFRWNILDCNRFVFHFRARSTCLQFSIKQKGFT